MCGSYDLGPGAIASAASATSGHPAASAIDDDLATTWEAATATGPAWLTLDLGALDSLRGLEVVFARDDLWRYRLEGSVDGDGWSTLVDADAGVQGRAFADDVDAVFRFVRLTATGSGGAAGVAALRVLGGRDGTNLARDAAATVTSGQAHYGAAQAVDGNTSTFWVGGAAPQSLSVDLGRVAWVTRVANAFVDHDLHRFTIAGSADGATWSPRVDRAAGLAVQAYGQTVAAHDRYVRFDYLGSARGYAPASRELEVFGFTDRAGGAVTTATVAGHDDDAAAATDDDDATAWRAPSPGAAAITVDLGASTSLARVEQTFADADAWALSIDGSVDGVRWSRLADVAPGAATTTQIARDVGGAYRFVRVGFPAASHAASSRSLRVYGTPLERDLARGVVVTSSPFAVGHGPASAVDGDSATAWIADGAALPQSLVVDLGHASQLTRLGQSFVDVDDYRYTFEGSLDRVTWTLLADHHTAVHGQSFTDDVHGTYRYVRFTELGSAAGHWANSRELTVRGVGSPVRARWWEHTSGVLRYYLKEYRIPLASIRSQLDELRRQGVHVLELFAPYQGPGDVWAGLGATDNYAVDPSIGTMADFDGLVADAHARGLRVTMFGNCGYARDSAPFFAQACDDQRNGVDSVVRHWFDFSDGPGPGRYFSTRANAWYYAAWQGQAPAGVGIPSYDFHDPAWQTECRNVLSAWLGHGLDGIALDAVGSYDGIDPTVNEASIARTLEAYGAWSNPEGSEDRALVTDWHYHALQDYSLVQWGGGGYSATLNAIDAGNTRPLEDLIKSNRDLVTAVGGVTLAPPSWERADVPASRRLFEIATLTTLGTMFWLHNGQDAITYPAVVTGWSQADRETLYALTRAQNATTALGPVGARARLPSSNDDAFFAFRRTSGPGGVQALVVLNFLTTPQSIRLDLRNSGIHTPQQPVDLVTGRAAAAITDAAYTVSLPALGYAVLSVH